MGMVDAADRGATVRIVLWENKSGRAMVVLEAGGERRRIATKVQWSRLEAFRDKLVERLYQAVRATGGVRQQDDWDRIREAVGLLDDIGSSMMYDLFEGAREAEFWNFLVGHVPTLAEGGPPAGYEPPLIEVEAADEYIPFGLIPALGEKSDKSITDLPSLRQAMFHFLGMASVIRQVQFVWPADDVQGGRPASISQDRLLWNEGKLPLKSFQDSSLYGAQIDYQFFAGLADFIELDGPWPSEAAGDVDESTVAPKLANALWRPFLRFDGRDREPGDQVHHFSCHCHTDLGLTGDYSLSLGSEAAGPFDISMEKLKSALRKERAVSPKRVQGVGSPLLFFSACGSSSSSPKGLPRLPQMFAESHRAMIGTETEVPDEVATTIGETFYLSLLSGSTVGQSLHNARWYLVDFYRNPLGVLYTLHGDPGLRVSHPWPDLLP
jgi:hypothetical protein